MSRVLRQTFFQRPTLVVAEELLGKFLVLQDADGKENAYLIREVEAYDGPEDLASHASRGKTARTSIMFGPGGYWYVYLIYGMYWMLNIVTGDAEYPAAILIRGVGEYDGPGKLTRRLGIDKRFNERLATKQMGLWIEDRGPLSVSSTIKKTPRIGVDYAGPIWSKKHYRFVLEEKKLIPRKKK